ncbi:major facilitator superfamily protein [Citrobacter amalonaticus]|nr:major facilitator superfamily protein [Citrobacter amalonaticus]
MLSPWELSQAVVGLLSVAYLTGTWSSPKAGSMTVRYGRGPVMLFSTVVMLFGLLMTLFSFAVADFRRNAALFSRILWRAFGGQLAGLGRVRVAPKARPLRCICSAIIWGPVSPVRSAVCSGITMAGTALGDLSRLCWYWLFWVGTRLHHRLHV